MSHSFFADSYSLLVDLRVSSAFGACCHTTASVYISFVFGDRSDCNVNALSLFDYRLPASNFACAPALVFSSHEFDPLVNHRARTVKPLLVCFFLPLALVTVVLSLFSVL